MWYVINKAEFNRDSEREVRRSGGGATERMLVIAYCVEHFEKAYSDKCDNTYCPTISRIITRSAIDSCMCVCEDYPVIDRH